MYLTSSSYNQNKKPAKELLSKCIEAESGTGRTKKQKEHIYKGF